MSGIDICLKDSEPTVKANFPWIVLPKYGAEAALFGKLYNQSVHYRLYLYVLYTICNQWSELSLFIVHKQKR